MIPVGGGESSMELLPSRHGMPCQQAIPGFKLSSCNLDPSSDFFFGNNWDEHICHVGGQIYIILSVYCAPHVPLLKYWRLEKVRPVIFYFTQFTHTLTSFDFCSGTIQYYLFSFSRCAIVILVNCKSSLTFGWCFPLFSWPLPCHQWGRRRSAPEMIMIIIMIMIMITIIIIISGVEGDHCQKLEIDQICTNWL